MMRLRTPPGTEGTGEFTHTLRPREHAQGAPHAVDDTRVAGSLSSEPQSQQPQDPEGVRPLGFRHPGELRKIGIG